MGVIYVITNSVNGKRYVGQTSGSMHHRWRGHVRIAGRKNCTCAIHLAITKYGPESFEVAQLEECDNAAMNDREVFWIDELRTFAGDDRVEQEKRGYNLTRGGDGMRGWHHTEASKQKMRRSHVGKRLSDAHKLALSIAGRGRVFSLEHRKRLGDSARRTMMGKHLSDETKRKLSAANAGKKVSDVTRQKLSLANMGKHLTPDVRAKIGTSLSKSAKKTPVIQCDKETHETIRTYSSVKEAATTLNIAGPNIVECCRGRRSSAGGYFWTYVEESVK